jgi:hypothetical protein
VSLTHAVPDGRPNIGIDRRCDSRDPFSAPAPCAPVYPWNFVRTNTIYGVIHAAGGRTAWADKHAVYAAVSGPTILKILGLDPDSLDAVRREGTPILPRLRFED